MTKQILEINGCDFERMIRNGLANLSRQVEEVNALNVFPVPDGDTGSNMYLTLKNAVDRAKPDKDLCEYLKRLSDTMLLGARGNSGVILSQLFRGFAERLRGKDEADAGDLCSALKAAYKAAYAAVKRPVEGTMLTVAREGIEKSRSQIRSSMPIDQLFSFYLAEMRRSLSYTPTLLPALKEAGVVDSGGMGYILIVEGMLKALYGETVDPEEPQNQPVATMPQVDTEGFDADAEFTFGYCTEFLLQLLRSRTDIDAFNADAFSDVLSVLGDSVVVVRSGDRVKVHVHTQTPSAVIALAQKYGEFVTFKLENMHLQHSQFMSAPKKQHYDLAVLAVSNGEGMTKLYQEFECCRVIEGGEMMNVSCQEFINAFDSIDADQIVVLPNNKNTISAATQAAQLNGQKNITVLSSANVVQGYLALSLDIATDAVQERVDAFRDNVEQTRTLCIARAVRPATINGEACSAGDYLAFMKGRVLGCGKDMARLICEALNRADAGDVPEYLQVFRGAAMPEEKMEQLAQALEEGLGGVEVACFESGHAVYDVIIGLF